MYNLVEKYKLLLNKHNISQNKLSREAGINAVSLQDFVSRGTIKISILKKIADYFKIPITYFFTDDKNLIFADKYKLLNETNQTIADEFIEILLKHNQKQ